MDMTNKEYDELISEVKRKREEYHRKRREEKWNNLKFPTMRNISTKTIAQDLVAVRPMGMPTHYDFFNYDDDIVEYEEE